MPSWISLIPPLIVLIFAIATHNVLRSLLLGIGAASLIAANFSILGTIKIGLEKLFHQTGLYDLIHWTGNFDQIYIYGFLLLLGIIITLITYAGGTLAYSKQMSGKLTGKRSAEVLSLSISPFFFLDDYFNCLTTGSIIRPIFDHFKIARAKLAFLIDVMSSPMAVLIPLSSWTAMILAQLVGSGITEELTNETLIVGDPYLIYLKAIPYTVYPFFIIITAWLIVNARISYGSMAYHEKIAATTGNLLGGKNLPIKKMNELEHTEGTLIDFLMPMGMLIGFIFLGLLYTGNYSLFGGKNSFLAAIRSSESFPAFFFAGLVTLVISTFYFLLTKKISLHAMKSVYIGGSELMKNSILLVLFAATLGTLLKDNLQTGQYLATLLIGSVPTFLLPLIFFITSSAVAASTGSSWGTILVVFPIAIPLIASVSGGGPELLASSVSLLLPTIGAILSGSVAGAHVSPISDTTVISSTAAGCNHIDHVSTQFSYAMPAVIGTCAASIAAGLFADKSLLFSMVIPFTLGLTITIGLILLMNALYKKRNA